MDSEYPHIAFLTYAESFADAASVIVDSGQASKLRLVMTYLYGHAIELAAKSILLNHGKCPENLKEIGHNLNKCLEQATKYPEGSFFDEELRDIIRLLNPEYVGKRLDYHPGETLMLLPCEKLMQGSIVKLLRSLRKSYTPARRPQKRV